MNHELPNMAEQTGISNTFKGLEQGSQARIAQRDTFRAAERNRLEDSRVTNLEQWLAARSTLIADGLVPVEINDSKGLPIRGALPAAAALVLFLAACGGGADNQIKINKATGTATENATPVATASPTAKPTETRPATTPPVTAEATPKPEQEVPAGQILSPELSATGEIIDWDYQGQTYKLAAFRLKAGTRVLVPKDGQLARTKADDPFTGTLASLIDVNSSNPTSIELIGDLTFDAMTTIDVKSGDLAGKIGGTGVTETKFGDYNFIVFITIKNPNGKGFVTDMNMLRQVLPLIADKPPVKRVNQTEQVPLSNVNTVNNPHPN